jgi:DNA-binding CsgD family transcriptional regulator
MGSGGDVRDIRLLELIERIYATVQNPELWSGVVGEISQALGGDSIAIYAGFPGSKTPELLAMNDIAADAWKPFSEYYALINPLMPRFEQRFAPGTTWFSQDGMSDAELEPTEFYQDFYRPNDMHFSLGLRIPLWGAAAGSMSCQRSKAAGAFAPETDRIVQTLKPHLQRALTLHHQMTGIEAQRLGLGAAFDAFDQGVFLLDAAGRVVYANSRAEAVLRAAEGLKLAQGRLRAVLPDQDQPLQQLLQAALRLGVANGTPSRFLLLSRRRQTLPLRVSAAPFRLESAWLGAGVGAVVFVHDPALQAASRAEAMRALFGLTPTESRVAEHLLAGLETNELAARMAITQQTARFHIKRILAKTGTRRQTELMRLMLSLPGV